MLVRACLAAAFAVLPLFAPEVWSGFRIAQSDVALSVIAATEQPLSVRSPGGLWAMLLALAWFGLAYWQRKVTWWEATLVVVGGSVGLARAGNAWLFGLAMLVPLARHLTAIHVSRLIAIGLVSVSLAVGAYTLVITRPPALPSGAVDPVGGSREVIFADWRWARELQAQTGARVLAAGGLASESNQFWLDYLRVALGHERWAEILERLQVQQVVLDSADQDRAAANLLRQAPGWHVVYDADGVLVAQRSNQ